MNMEELCFEEQKGSRGTRADKATCKNCNELKRIYGKELCSTCYFNLDMNPKKVICLKCGKLNSHYGNGMCRKCCVTERHKRQYREDKTFRERCKANSRRWQKAHPEKMREYNRKSHKGIRTLAKLRCGFICSCGNLIKVAGGAKKYSKTMIKCPQCRRHYMHKELTPCDYNRFTQEIIKRYERGK
jgi:hypothetical protein